MSELSISLKFGRGGEENESFRYENLYERQSRNGTSRLLIGPSDNHCQLLLRLTACLPEPLKVLYVLVVSRRDEHSEARYESHELSREQVTRFVQRFEQFFESDARHHIWVANPDVGTIVYDRHEVLYAYGPIDAYVAVLQKEGLHSGVVEIPAPHWHAYHAEFDEVEADVMRYWRWEQRPLNEADKE
jgi:hypothetical protein